MIAVLIGSNIAIAIVALFSAINALMSGNTTGFIADMWFLFVFTATAYHLHKSTTNIA